MDWSNIASIIAALAVFIGLPLALRNRKKGGLEKMKQFLHHLQTIEVKASLVERGADEEKVGIGHASGQRSEGVIKIDGRNIDYIKVISVTSQYGVNYYLQDLVTTTDIYSHLV